MCVPLPRSFSHNHLANVKWTNDNHLVVEFNEDGKIPEIKGPLKKFKKANRKKERKILITENEKKKFNLAETERINKENIQVGKIKHMISELQE